TWKQPASEEAVVKYRVFWNNNADSLEIPAPSIDSVGVMILNLAKKNYTFLVHAYTAQGVKSQGKIVSGKVYGGQYESALVNRAVEQAVVNDEAKTAVITWEAAVSGAIASEIKYTNSMGTVHTETVLSAVKNTILNNYKSGSAFAYRTLYLPQAAAIDTFYTAYDSVEVNPIA